MTGVDLTRIDGVDAYTALKVISEIGADMTKWPSAKHFASWLGLSPNNRITGGRVMSSKTKASGNRAAAALRLAANALHRSGRQRPGRLPAPEESSIQRALRAAKRRAAQLGYQLVPISHGEHQDTQDQEASRHSLISVTRIDMNRLWRLYGSF